jgi:ABC-2 type transport system ATP-binding protein
MNTSTLPTILEVKNLNKRFGSLKAVEDVSFTLNEGEILGLLGVNGAGKTTTLQMLLGVLTPTSGEISYFGKNLFTHREEILEEVNFSSTYTNLPWLLTVYENLLCLSYLYRIENRKERLAKVIKIFRLGDLLKKQVIDLSAGQLTRVNLAKSFLNFPRVLLLDEPTASLDPEVASYIRTFLLEERKKFNLSIILTSHNMSEVEELCDRVIFINQGKIVADDTPQNLAKTIEICHIELFVTQGFDKLLEYCRSKRLPRRVHGRYVAVDVKEKEIPGVLRDLMEHGVAYEEISIEKPTLEDYFFETTRRITPKL